jgi:predicted nucleic acid-binding protein
VIVVSDASPLISLAAIDRLDLLRRLYNEVIIPEAVRREVVMTAPGAAGAADVAGANWINVRSVEDRTLVEALRVTLDMGEAEAIALALEVNADLLLVDERRARAVAQRLGQPVIGVLGVIVEAKLSGLIPAVGPLLGDLTDRAGFRVSEALRARVIEVGGE